MGLPRKSYAFAAALVAALSLALLLPAQAQFWDWGNRPQRQQHYNNNNGWFGGGGGWFAPDRRYYERQEREAVDYSHAPPPAQKKPEATSPIVVMGDANADWLAYGLEDAFSENPDIAIVRKHRTDSGLIRYDQRRDVEWPQAAREIIAAEKPKFIVMMVGNYDRQTIREKVPPPPARPGAGKANTQASQAAPPAGAAAVPPPPTDPEQQAPEAAQAVQQHPNMTPEQARQAAYGPWEFRSEKWEIAYTKRIDATIAALKSAGVPVIWVGLPSQRGPKASGDSSYLNELYRSRAEKAGIVYVDIWDGFVDESGRYSPQGPDYEGQIRRLRSGDGVYYTKFGARKLAHYVEREIQRVVAKGMPVALPSAEPGPLAPDAKSSGPAARPAVGPVVPLTVGRVTSEELIGGGRSASSAGPDASAARVLTKGEPIAAPSGRADNFSWPRSSVSIEPATAEPPPQPAAPDADEKSAKGAAEAQAGDANAEQKPVQRRPRPRANPNPWAQQRMFNPFSGFFR
ncbi:MAG TPA: DUF459 domain-containing protein [Xanthobacteraceae bacterium]|jgi:hypothetical protein